jgi:hypothetical protein
VDNETFRQIVLYRLKSVGLSEDEYENFIRREPKDLFNNVPSEKLQALATVINKEDFKENYNLTEEQYAQIDNRFDISGQKAVMNQKVQTMIDQNDPSPNHILINVNGQPIQQN